jgi:hypothetical protein
MISQEKLEELKKNEPALATLDGEGCLCILSKNGDDRLTWNRRFKDQVEEARKKFYEMLGKGHVATRISSDGKEGRRITQFDPSAEEVLIKSFDLNASKIIMRPMLVGG